MQTQIDKTKWNIQKYLINTKDSTKFQLRKAQNQIASLVNFFYQTFKELITKLFTLPKKWKRATLPNFLLGQHHPDTKAKQKTPQEKKTTGQCPL